MNRLWKQIAFYFGSGMVLVGCVLLPGVLIWLALSFADSDSGRYTGMVYMLLLVIIGSGAGLSRHGSSLSPTHSRLISWPPLWLLGWGWVGLLFLGALLRVVPILGGLLFPPIYLLVAVLPPLAAVVWAGRNAAEPLTWRRVWVTATCGIWGALLALLLEIAVSFLFSALIVGFSDSLGEFLENLEWLLTFSEVARPMAGGLSFQVFIMGMLELAVIVPLVEEFAKPLLALPLIRQAPNERHAFLLGALVGLGFAAVENLLYTGLGELYWVGAAALRALGCAIHPLASGWIAVAWYRWFVTREVRRSLPWVGIGLGLHALWNGGTILLLMLVGEGVFGARPPEVRLWGLPLAGVVLAFLALVGAGAWLGLRAFPRAREGVPAIEFSPELPAARRALALWAVVCLVVALALGLGAVQLFR